MNFSNSRPPPQGAPGRFGFMYRRSLRPVVIATSTLTAFWTLLWGIGSFQDANKVREDKLPKLATFSIVLGAMYMAVVAIEILGVVAAFFQRLVLIRIYAIGSILGALIVTAAGLLRTVIHFTNKNDLINECTNIVSGQEVTFRFGIWGPTTHEILSPADAARWCKKAYDHDSFSEIVSLIITILLGALFTSIAFGYYRQVLDPTSPVNASRAPSNQVRMDATPLHYNQPYNASIPNLSYDAPYGGPPQSQYAPPPGAPPLGGADAKPPAYGYGPSVDVGAEKDVKGENPFADFEGASSHGHGERDVTSRPRPGEEGGFRV